MYPIWIRLVYNKFGEQTGYTGSLTSKENLIDLMIRLGINYNEINSFEINGKIQPSHEIEKIFEEVSKKR